MKKIAVLVLMIFAGTSAFAIEDVPCQKRLFGRCKAVEPQAQEMTLGVVQREIRAGISMDEVAATLGSPNIVTKDSEGKDTWIYDKVSRVTSYSGSGAYGTILIAGRATEKGKYQTEQKTLTVVIKFDKTNKVETLTYHMSKF
jgi:outer membrane protein assembly factor BamE (lipoprotein component of BamABCDE complex)